LVSGRTGGVITIVSIFLPWWTMYVSGFGVSAFASIWLFGTLVSGSALGYGITQGALVSDFWVAAIFVILSGALGIVSTRDRKFSLAGGALGLFGALVFLITLGNLSTGVPRSIFFGVENGFGMSAFWFLSIGFWLAIIGSIIMLVASPTTHEQPIREMSKPFEEPALVHKAEIARTEKPRMEVRYCSNCGAQLEPEAKFCSECGSVIGKDSAKRKRAGKKRIKRKRKAKTTR
jgi:predicted nucleic acid-binding Zn ribbon protein